MPSPSCCACTASPFCWTPPHAPCVSDGGAPCASDIKPPTPRPRDTCGPDATSTPSPAPHNTAPQQKRAAPPERGEGSPHRRTATRTRTQAEHHGPRLQNRDQTHGGSWTPALCPDPCPCLRDREGETFAALGNPQAPTASHTPQVPAHAPFRGRRVCESNGHWKQQ